MPHSSLRFASLSRGAKWLSAGFVAGVVAAAATLAFQHPEVGAASREPLQTTQPPLRFAERLDVRAFQRGNLHAHSAMSDGDSPAELVVAWYKEHGYQFLALSDHNRRLDRSRFGHLETERFTLLPAEEVTMAAGGLPVHVNAICHERTIGYRNFRTPAEALRWSIDEIHEQGGVALVNHPNFHWAFDVETIAAAPGAALLEIFNGHPHVYSDGDAKHPSVERMWEELLDRGHVMAVAAVDDMHALREERTPGVSASRPGTAWVEVFAATADRQALCRALGEGKLYASNGPRLARFTVDTSRITLWFSDESDVEVEFIGEEGEVLATMLPGPEVGGLSPASYRLQGHERFVRARVTAADGRRAWTQAYFTTR